MIDNNNKRLHKGLYLFPDWYTDEKCIQIQKAESLGWEWIDPRSGFAYEWKNSQGIYVLEGPTAEQLKI